MKILPAVAELLHADVKTDRHKEDTVVVTFRNFAKTSINHNVSRTLQPKSGLGFLFPIKLSLSLFYLYCFILTTSNKATIIKQLRILTQTTICL